MSAIDNVPEANEQTMRAFPTDFTTGCVKKCARERPRLNIASKPARRTQKADKRKPQTDELGALALGANIADKGPPENKKQRRPRASRLSKVPNKYCMETSTIGGDVEPVDAATAKAMAATAAFSAENDGKGESNAIRTKPRKKPSRAKPAARLPPYDGDFRVLAFDVGTVHLAFADVTVRVFAAAGKDPVVLTVHNWVVDSIIPDDIELSPNRSIDQLTKLMTAHLRNKVATQVPADAIDVLLVEQQDFDNKTMIALSHVIHGVGELLWRPRFSATVSAMVKVAYVRGRSTGLVPPHGYAKLGITSAQAYKWRKEGLVTFVTSTLGMTPPAQTTKNSSALTNAQQHDLCDAMLIAISCPYYFHAYEAIMRMQTAMATNANSDAE